MSEGWSLASLGDVVIQRKQFITIDDIALYKRCRVQLHAKGIVLRDRVPGAEIKTKQQQVCQTGEFLVAEIDAKVGGFGIVPEDLDGAIVSSHYFLFKINEACLERRWLHFMIQTPQFREQVAAQGSTNYAAIRPHDVLGYQIPLPPLPEQQRILARIEELASKIERAQELRRQAIAETSKLLPSISNEIFSRNCSLMPLSSFLIGDSRNGIGIAPTNDSSGVPILRISAGTSRSDGVVNESDYKYVEVDEKTQSTYRLLPGDLLACRFNGNLHFVGLFSLFTGYSKEIRLYPDKLIRFRVDPNQVLPEYVRYATNSPQCRTVIETMCATTAGNIGISAGRLKTVSIPVFPLDEQKRIIAKLDGLQAKIDTMKVLQTQTQAELDALLPSVLDRAFRGEL